MLLIPMTMLWLLLFCLVKLRDTGNFGFLLPADQIKPSGIETSSGFVALGKALATELEL